MSLFISGNQYAVTMKENTIVYGDSQSRYPIVERKSTSICVSEKLEKGNQF